MPGHSDKSIFHLIYTTLFSIASKNSHVIKLSGAIVGVDGNIYASGDLLGKKLTFDNAVSVAGGSGLLQSIVVQDLSNQRGALDVIIFDADPSGTVFTNNDVLDVVDADLPKIIGAVSITAWDYISFNDNAVAIKSGLAIPVDLPAGGDLYACCVSRDTKTYIANELSLAFGILRD